MLFAAGLITGEALVGIFIAMCIWISKNPDVLAGERRAARRQVVGGPAPAGNLLLGISRRNTAPRHSPATGTILCMRDPRYSVKLMMCLGTIYLVWGSSFLFSKIAVNHLPIALFSAIRFVTAGTVARAVGALLARSLLSAPC